MTWEMRLGGVMKQEVARRREEMSWKAGGVNCRASWTSPRISSSASTTTPR